MTRAHLLAGSLLLAGCFDSLISSPCARGFTLQAGQCVALDLPDAATDLPDTPDAATGGDGNDARVDAGPDVHDAGQDAAVCTLDEVMCDGVCIDVSADPDNCGACNRVCASGICTLGHCAGAPWGHIVAIGHDYMNYHPAMARVLGNAVALGLSHDVSVAWWVGTASESSQSNALSALTAGMAAQARPFHSVALPATPSASAFAGIDVLVVPPQVGDGNALEATAVTWKTALDGFLGAGGVVVVLEGHDTVSYRFARGASLYSINAPVDVSGHPAMVVAPSDAVAEHVVSPYLAETSSMALRGIGAAVVTTAPGDVVVAHLTR